MSSPMDLAASRPGPFTGYRNLGVKLLTVTVTSPLQYTGSADGLYGDGISPLPWMVRTVLILSGIVHGRSQTVT